MAEENLEQRLKSFEDTIKGLKHEVERLQAVNEIQNLMSTYEYFHMTNHHEEVMKMYPKNVPDVRVSMKETGYWQGFDAPKRAWS